MKAETKKALKQCGSREDLNQLLLSLEESELLDSDVLLLNRILDRWPSALETRIACLASFNLDPFPLYVRVLNELSGQPTAMYVGEYNQYYQEILLPSGPLSQFDPEIVFLAASLRQLCPDVVTAFDTLSDQRKEEATDRVVEHLGQWADNALHRMSATVVISNFIPPASRLTATSDTSASRGYTEFYSHLNLRLLRRFKVEPRISVLNLDQLAADFGRYYVFDAKMYYLAKREWSQKFVRVVAGYFTRICKAVKGPRKKCLVLDLDNTLWGGIVGEDGPYGVRIGAGDPEGEAYLDFQHGIRRLKDSGIILAICSKNNMGDVTEVFEKRPMPLRLSDFAAAEVNWENKANNLKRIAASLNIGTDSLVLLDDSPFECNLVRQLLPDVKTIELPNDPAKRPALVDEFTDFDRLAVTQEDVAKAQQYSQQRERRLLEENITDLSVFLQSLGTVVGIRRATARDLQRLEQLFSKTNQFNLTTKRYSLGQIEETLSSEKSELFVVNARDRLGDLGDIGLYLVRIQGNQRILDSFILSCRAMGRGIETAMMNHLKIRAEQSGGRTIRACYMPTRKNEPIGELCEKQGFSVVETSADGAKQYVLNADDIEMLRCDWIEVELD